MTRSLVYTYILYMLCTRGLNIRQSELNDLSKTDNPVSSHSCLPKCIVLYLSRYYSPLRCTRPSIDIYSDIYSSICSSTATYTVVNDYHFEFPAPSPRMECHGCFKIFPSAAAATLRAFPHSSIITRVNIGYLIAQ
jgi:hypothetical protein